VTTSEEFKDLFENAPCGYLTMAPDGRITWVNQTLCAWTGYACDDFAGKRVHQFLNMAGRIYFETLPQEVTACLSSPTRSNSAPTTLPVVDPPGGDQGSGPATL
jgi:hypothetical protein